MMPLTILHNEHIDRRKLTEIIKTAVDYLVPPPPPPPPQIPKNKKFLCHLEHFLYDIKTSDWHAIGACF